MKKEFAVFRIETHDVGREKIDAEIGCKLDEAFRLGLLSDRPTLPSTVARRAGRQQRYVLGTDVTLFGAHALALSRIHMRGIQHMT